MEAKITVTISVLEGLTSVVKMPRLGCLVVGHKTTFYDAGEYKKFVLYHPSVTFNEGTEFEFKHSVFAERMLYDKREFHELKKLLADNVGQTFDVTLTLVPVVKGMNSEGQATPLVGERGNVANRMICKITKMEWAKRVASFKGIIAPPTKKNTIIAPKPAVMGNFEGLD